MVLGDRLGIAGLILGLLATAAFYLWPDKRWIGQVCLGLAVVLIISWSTLEIKQKWGANRMSFAGALLVGAIIGGISAGVLWQSSAAHAPAQAPPEAATTPKENGQLKLYAEAQITALPIEHPSDGIVRMMQLQPNAQANVIGQSVSSSGSLELENAKPAGPRIYTCKIINYGAETVVNITVAIRVTFSKMIDEGGGHSRSGPVRFNADCPFMIPKIDPGTDNAYTFYMGNFWDEFVTVTWPDTATVTTVGDAAVRVVPFAHPPGQLFFPAFHEAVVGRSTPHPSAKQRVEHRPEPAVSQVMTNSPGGIQATGDVNVTQPRARHLVDEQRTRLIAALKDVQHGNLQIACNTRGGDEPCNFGRELADVLRTVGWRVSLSEMMGWGPPDKPVCEMCFIVRPQSAVAQSGVPLETALKGIGFSAGHLFKDDAPDDVLYLEINQLHQSP